MCVMPRIITRRYRSRAVISPATRLVWKAKNHGGVLYCPPGAQSASIRRPFPVIMVSIALRVEGHLVLCVPWASMKLYSGGINFLPWTIRVLVFGSNCRLRLLSVGRYTSKKVFWGSLCFLEQEFILV